MENQLSSELQELSERLKKSGYDSAALLFLESVCPLRNLFNFSLETFDPIGKLFLAENNTYRALQDLFKSEENFKGFLDKL